MSLKHFTPKQVLFPFSCELQSSAMATGDLKNNLRKLISDLKQARFPQDDLNVKGLAQGVPLAFLPILHYVFVDFSYALAQYFAGKDYELFGKSDLRFMEVVYRVLRDEFGYKPQLSREQFLSIGFAERKILLVGDILRFCREKHKQLDKKRGKIERKKKDVISLPGNCNHKNLGSVKVVEQRGSSERIPRTKDSGIGFPLPANADIRSVRSDKGVVQAGIMSLGQDSWFENKENMGALPRTLGVQVAARPKTTTSESNTASSKLIIRTLGSHVGGKFQPVRHMTQAGKVTKPRTVTWHDEVFSLQENEKLVEQTALPSSLDQILMQPQSQPNLITSTIHQPKTLSGGTMERANDSTQGTPQSLPVPVPRRTVPQPSEDLMLSPSGKVTHQPIPLSGSRGCYVTPNADVSLIDITESVYVPHAQVTRHEPSSDVSAKKVLSYDMNPSHSVSASSEEVYFLKQQVQELQEKFDSVMLQNNEMSARVVLLESRMKLLEESCSRNVCSNCSGSEKDMHVPASEIKVLSGFGVPRGSPSLDEKEEACDFNRKDAPLRSSNHLTSRRLHLENSYYSMEELSPTNDTKTGHNSSESNEKQHPTKTVDLSIISDESESQSSCVEQLSTPTRGHHLSSHESDAVVSPLATPDVSLTFANSGTKATVANVHKRLKETREMLTRTNRDFATRFGSCQQD